MIVSKLLRPNSWKFVLAGLVCLIGAFWLYPGSVTQEWNKTEWKRSLSGSKWTFSREDGSVISDQFTLAPLGYITGYSHPNETRWTVRGRTLTLLNEAGSVSARFALGTDSSGLPARLQQLHGGRHVLTLMRSSDSTLFFFSALAASLGVTCFVGALRDGPNYVHKMRTIVSGSQLARVILGIWFLLTCTIASTSAFVPDEAWFLYEALASGKQVVDAGEWVQQLLYHRNTLGYGGLWWSLYTGLAVAWHGVVDMYGASGAGSMLTAMAHGGNIVLWEHAPEVMVTPMVMMRFLSLFSLAVFGLTLVRQARSGGAAVLAALVLVTMPLAWWSGKLASPELLGGALFAIGVAQWFIGGRALPALVLASMALAMKLTIAPVYVVLVAFIAWETWRRPDFTVRRLLAYACVCFVVVLASNAWLLHDPKSGIEQLIFLSNTYRPFSDLSLQSQLVLQLQPDMWEGTNYGSLAYWSGGFSLVIASLAVAFCLHRRLGVFLLVGGLMQYLFMLTQPPHGWYWFAAILPLVIPFSQLTSKAAAGVGVILLACLLPFAAMRNEVSYKTLHLRELNDLALERNCVQEKLRAYQPQEVYDMAAIGTMASRMPDSEWKSYNFHDSFVSFMGAPLPATGSRRVLLLGERSRQRFDPLRILSNVPGKLIGECGSVKLIKVGE